MSDKKENDNLPIENDPISNGPEQFDWLTPEILDSMLNPEGIGKLEKFPVEIYQPERILKAIEYDKSGLIAFEEYRLPLEHIVVEMRAFPGAFNIFIHFNPMPSIGFDPVDFEKIKEAIDEEFGVLTYNQENSFHVFEVGSEYGKATKFILQQIPGEGFDITTGTITKDGRTINKRRPPANNEESVYITLDNVAEVISFVATKIHEISNLELDEKDSLTIMSPWAIDLSREQYAKMKIELQREAQKKLEEAQEQETQDLTEVVAKLKEKRHITFKDIGGYEETKDELRMISEAIKNPDVYSRYGASLPSGLIFYGPPGNGKTLMAEALANEAGVNFVSISSSDIFDMWLGNSEKNMTKIFDDIEEGEDMTVLFFDEIDTLFESRNRSSHEVTKKVQGIFFQRTSGIKRSKKLFLVLATNRIEDLDEALLRSGRVDLRIEINKPNEDAREKIFGIHVGYIEERASQTVFDISDWKTVVKATDGFSGADIPTFLSSVIREKIKRQFLYKEDQGMVTLEEVLGAVESFKKALGNSNKSNLGFNLPKN